MATIYLHFILSVIAHATTSKKACSINLFIPGRKNYYYLLFPINRGKLLIASGNLQEAWRKVTCKNI